MKDPFWPKPMNADAFQGLAGDLVRLVEPETEADPHAILISLLVAFGNACGRARFFHIGQGKHYANEFAVIAGKSSRARKGTSWAIVKDLMRQVDRDWSKRVRKGLGSGQGLIHHVRDADPDSKDPGAPDKRLLVLEEEFSAVLRLMGAKESTISTMIRSAFDDGDLQTTTKNQSEMATGAHITIIGHLTKCDLEEHMGRTDRTNGFANRFLWVCAKATKAKPDSSYVDLGPVTGPYSDALRFGKQYALVELSKPALELWCDHYYAELRQEKKNAYHDAVTSRAPVHVLRLALIYSILEKSPFIDNHHLISAMEVWRYCDESALYLFGKHIFPKDARKVLSILERDKCLTRTELSHALQGHYGTTRIDEALAFLSEHGLAMILMQDSPSGPPTQQITLCEQCEQSNSVLVPLLNFD